MNIPIVIAAFNRKDCLLRLLNSLDSSEYPSTVKLIISIDGGGCPDVINIAESFDWEHGEKEVIIHKDNMGLRKHIIACASLSEQYDGVILLEDDLYVSPHFYKYVQETANYYKEDKNISGIALYSPVYCETAMLPFTPLDDGNDVYFMQLACSWGQCWLKDQWRDFIQWYEVNYEFDIASDNTVPQDIRLWPASSWKKYFIKYMIEFNKYFVYPRVAYTTNFGDAGQHHKGSNLFQSPLQYGYHHLNKVGFDDSFVKYDAFGEISPESLKIFNSDLEDYDFAVDIYGYKDIDSIESEFVLTTKECSKYELSFGLKMKPHEANVISNIPGERIIMSKTTNVKNICDFINDRISNIANWKSVHSYYFSITEMHYFEFNTIICCKENTIRNTIAENQNRISELTASAESLRNEIKMIQGSVTYRLGKFLLTPLRVFKNFIRSVKG